MIDFLFLFIALHGHVEMQEKNTAGIICYNTSYNTLCLSLFQ